jgi:hypothetical protein
VAGLSTVVLDVEPLLIVLWIISSGSGDKPLPIIQLSTAVQNHDQLLIMGYNQQRVVMRIASDKTFL